MPVTAKLICNILMTLLLHLNNPIGIVIIDIMTWSILMQDFHFSYQTRNDLSLLITELVRLIKFRGVWVCVCTQCFFTCCCSFSSCCCFSCRTCSCCSADTMAWDRDWSATWAAELRAVEASPTVPVDRPPTAGVTPNVLTGVKEEKFRQWPHHVVKPDSSQKTS